MPNNFVSRFIRQELAALQTGTFYFEKPSVFRFHLIAAMTAEPSWNGEKERISIEMIRRYVDPFSTSFYTSGPPGLVTAMREMLALNGVRRDQVLFESFSGY